MRTIQKFEIKMGDNRVSIPIQNDVVGVGEAEGKVWLLVEVDDSLGEMCEMSFLMCKVGDEIDERAVLEVVGCVRVDGVLAAVWEVL